MRQETLIMTAKVTLFLILLTQILGVALATEQASTLIGSWRVEIAFENGERRSFRLDARAAGKGSFLPLGPRQIGPTEPSAAEWTQSDDHSLSVSGPVQFPLGNVGLARGTMVLKGKFGIDGSITGEACFFPSEQDPKDPKATPSKSGTFSAVRVRD